MRIVRILEANTRETGLANAVGEGRSRRRPPSAAGGLHQRVTPNTADGAGFFVVAGRHELAVALFIDAEYLPASRRLLSPLRLRAREARALALSRAASVLAPQQRGRNDKLAFLSRAFRDLASSAVFADLHRAICCQNGRRGYFLTWRRVSEPFLKDDRGLKIRRGNCPMRSTRAMHSSSRFRAR